MRGRLSASALAGAALLAVAGPAEAGPPGKWTKVTGVGGADRNIMEVGRARTPDGVLHVSWTREGAGNSASLLHSAISKNGKKVTGPHEIATFPGGINESSALVAGGGGLRVFFAGLSEGSRLSDSLSTATSANGTSWTLQPTPASNAADKSPVYAASGIGAARGLDGTLVSTWGDSAPGAGGFHAGISPATRDFPFGSECCNVDPNLSIEPIGSRVVAAWNVAGEDRMHAQSLGPAGPRLTLPGSGAAQLQQRVGITSRIGKNGTYVAYTSGSNPFLGRATIWRFGAGKAKVLSRKRRAQNTNIAAAPGGRLWVFWEREGRLYATRSNRRVTKWGAIVAVRLPGDAAVSRLHGEGSRGPLDLLAHMDPTGKPLATYHQRVRPGLKLGVKKATTGKVTFKVTDAGAGVRGAKVRVGQEGGTTAEGGKVTLEPAKGSHRARATKKGYTPARKRIRVN